MKLFIHFSESFEAKMKNKKIQLFDEFDKETGQLSSSQV